ncbi:S8 family serine peptidase [Paraglaciecola aestuariivivens]
MGICKLTLMTLLAFSQFSAAQVINTKQLLKPVDQITRSTAKIEQRLKQTINRPPFALSSLPPASEVITLPLDALPNTLAIGKDLTTPALIEVEVENGWRAVKHQWMVLASKSVTQKLIQLGAQINATESYAALGLELLRFTVPDYLDTKAALAKHLPAESMASLGRNHIYQVQTSGDKAQQSTAPNSPAKAMCNQQVSIGIIDSGIDNQHRVFAKSRIQQKSFLPESLSSPTIHGSAVASVLIGASDELSPLLPKAELYSAAVFYRQSEFAQGATLQAMIAGLNWLLEQQVKVINMSLSGPANAMLEQIIHAATKRGAFIVAAAGNEGPAAPAVYPAAYPPVIAVSAFDQQLQPYRWANRGDYIDFSALGVNVLSAQPNHSVGKESGTSMAAPVVAAALACIVAKNKKWDTQKVLHYLLQQAEDLGAKGRDPIYGEGAIRP